MHVSPQKNTPEIPTLFVEIDIEDLALSPCDLNLSVFPLVISWQAGSQCRGKCEKTAMVHRYISYGWLLKQTVSHVRTWNKAQTSAFCTINTFSVDWPRLFMCTYRHENLYRFTASLSLSHTVTFTRLSSTHIPTVQSTFRAEGIRVYLTQRDLLCIRNPWFTWLSPPRYVLYCRMNCVTSRQCQGEGNVSVPPWWAFPHSVSLRLMTPAWRALPQPGRAQRRWSEGEEHADCNHRQSSALPVDSGYFGPGRLAPDLWFELQGWVRQKKKEKEENNNNEDLQQQIHTNERF